MVYYMHDWDGITPVEEKNWRPLDTLVQAGKVAYVGVLQTIPAGMS